jgi:hypothetical protein
LSNFNSEPIDAADDPAFLEGNDSEPGGASPADDEMAKAFLMELQQLAVQAGELAST